MKSVQSEGSISGGWWVRTVSGTFRELLGLGESTDSVGASGGDARIRSASLGREGVMHGRAGGEDAA